MPLTQNRETLAKIAKNAKGISARKREFFLAILAILAREFSVLGPRTLEYIQ